MVELLNQELLSYWIGPLGPMKRRAV